jgi:hypothetical protein
VAAAGPDRRNWVGTSPRASRHGLVGSSSGMAYGLDLRLGQVVWTTDVGARIPRPDEQNVSQPPTRLGAGQGLLVVPETGWLPTAADDYIAGQRQSRSRRWPAASEHGFDRVVRHNLDTAPRCADRYEPERRTGPGGQPTHKSSTSVTASCLTPIPTFSPASSTSSTARQPCTRANEGAPHSRGQSEGHLMRRKTE